MGSGKVVVEIWVRSWEFSSVGSAQINWTIMKTLNLMETNRQRFSRRYEWKKRLGQRA